MFRFKQFNEKMDIGGAIGGIFGGSSGGSSGDTSIQAANIAAQSQREALDYYKQAMAPTLEAQKTGLQKYQQAINQPMSATSTEQLYSQALSNPMLAGQLKQAEEASLRASAATGGLRGGGAISDVANVRTGLINQAYQDEYNRDLQNLALQQQNISNLGSLAGLNTGSESIAGMMSGIGQTQAQGLIGQAQSDAAAQQAGFGNLMGLGQLGLSAYSLFSDEQLKKNIKHTGYENGIPTYTWDWNDKAEKLGLKGKAYGTLSKFAKIINPNSVSIKDGYEQVDYDMIGVSHG